MYCTFMEYAYICSIIIIMICDRQNGIEYARFVAFKEDSKFWPECVSFLINVKDFFLMH